jgi:hypothetical protein
VRRASLVLVLIVAACGCAHDTHKAPPPDNKEEAEGEKSVAAPPSTPTEPTPVQTASGVQVAPTTEPASGPPPKPLPPKVKILVHSRGPDKGQAFVFWGKKKLGETPVTLERPRDSGPVDLVVRAEGWFPVHTRAFTFRNDVIYVKMTKLDDRMTLYGAKHDADTPPPGTPDGGVPPALPAQ